MRPGQQNKRMRGRGRKGPNPLSRSYESNGPDVKIRGTAQHIAEKYAALARDAAVAGDRVMAENYLQHGEHYGRIVAAAQGSFTLQRDDRDSDGYEDDEEEGEDVIGELGAFPGGNGNGFAGEGEVRAQNGSMNGGESRDNRSRERNGENRSPDNRGQDNRGSENRGQDSRGPENRNQDNRNQDNRNQENRGNRDNRPRDNRPDFQPRENRGDGRSEGRAQDGRENRFRDNRVEGRTEARGEGRTDGRAENRGEGRGEPRVDARTEGRGDSNRFEGRERNAHRSEARDPQEARGERAQPNGTGPQPFMAEAVQPAVVPAPVPELRHDEQQPRVDTPAFIPDLIAETNPGQTIEPRRRGRPRRPRFGEAGAQDEGGPAATPATVAASPVQVPVVAERPATVAAAPADAGGEDVKVKRRPGRPRKKLPESGGSEGGGDEGGGDHLPAFLLVNGN